MGLQELMNAQKAAFFSAERFGETVAYTPKNQATRAITCHVHREEVAAIAIDQVGEEQPRRATITCAGSDLVGDDYYGDRFTFDEIEWTVNGNPRKTTGGIYVDLDVVSVKRRKLGNVSEQ